MPDNHHPPDNVIRGSCPDFVCRCCRTKSGWPHQPWCDCAGLTEPVCGDCAYYSIKHARCDHPVKKRKRRDAE